MNTETKEINTEYIWRLKKDWEMSFPDLIGDWTHYQIKGDGNELGVVEGQNLGEALNIVENNFGKYKLILVHRAKLNDEGGFLYEEFNNYHISTYEYDINNLADFKSFHDRQNPELNSSYTSKYKRLIFKIKNLSMNSTLYYSLYSIGFVGLIIALFFNENIVNSFGHYGAGSLYIFCGLCAFLTLIFKRKR